MYQGRHDDSLKEGQALQGRDPARSLHWTWGILSAEFTCLQRKIPNCHRLTDDRNYRRYKESNEKSTGISLKNVRRFLE